MDLNNGKFLENGECGYVLKPSVMRDGKTFVDSVNCIDQLVNKK